MKLKIALQPKMNKEPLPRMLETFTPQQVEDFLKKHNTTLEILRAFEKPHPHPVTIREIVYDYRMGDIIQTALIDSLELMMKLPWIVVRSNQEGFKQFSYNPYGPEDEGLIVAEYTDGTHQFAARYEKAKNGKIDFLSLWKSNEPQDCPSA